MENEEKTTLQKELETKRAQFRNAMNTSIDDWMFLEKERFCEEQQCLVTVFSREFKDALYSHLYVFTKEGRKQLYTQRCLKGVLDSCFIKDIISVGGNTITVAMEGGNRKIFHF